MSNTNTVRVERVEAPFTVQTMPVQEAVELFGADELLEHCMFGGNGSAVFFVEKADGTPIHPVTSEDLET